jgi:cell division transport system permease protein
MSSADTNISVRHAGSILQKGQASTRALTVVMAVMVYLAVLALASLILVERAVDNWAKGLASEATVQIREDSARNIDDDLKSALSILTQTQGVIAAIPLDRKASEDLLAPWIGSEGLDGLPIPRLIRVTADRQNPPDFALLQETLQAAVPVASLDTHRRWEDQLRQMAGTITRLSMLALGLIAACAVAMVVFAARAVLDANKPVIEVLYLAGADDRFIVKQFNTQFLIAGLWAGALGLFFGAATLFAFGYTRAAEFNGVATAARGLFHAPHGGEWRELVVFMLVPIAATLLAVITARIALTRMLGALR